jgi:hypothetical protein
MQALQQGASSGTSADDDSLAQRELLNDFQDPPKLAWLQRVDHALHEAHLNVHRCRHVARMAQEVLRAAAKPQPKVAWRQVTMPFRAMLVQVRSNKLLYVFDPVSELIKFDAHVNVIHCDFGALVP